ncbi:SGNH/GDSL hydrolase family protein [Vagococcus fluvialis]|uniref:SGNH/GDSL hydrolase family protein n=1 Tax=Vagococcus fluvialis TaxID=2738 RepID=UPI002B2F4B60|nr:SGNH/GDSL hydrolase family protein [Vagococcus fluvialis]
MKNKVFLIGSILFAIISVSLGLVVSKNRQANLLADSANYKNISTVKVKEEKKQIVTFGDSIFGNVRDYTSVPSVIENETNQTVKNVAFGGTRSSLLSKESPWNSLAFTSLVDEVVKDETDETKWKYQNESMGEETFLNYFEDGLTTLKEIDFNEVDIITIAFGTNDFTSEIPLDGEDVGSFQGSMNNSINKLKNKYPNTEIVVISPAYRYWKTESGEFLNDSDSNVLNGNKLTDFVSMTEKIAKDNGVKYINNYGLINFDNKDEYFDKEDSTHPNKAGRYLIGENVAKELNNK